ncbi:MAG: LdpA C-terminal domain-containing domain, partial [Coleofasciculaceae cyanobacterium]
QKVQSANLPGYVQLAGGTNDHTVAKLKSVGLFRSNTHEYATANQAYIAGVAYGSYARVLLAPILDELEKINGHVETSESSQAAFGQLEATPELLWQAVRSAASLVSQLKSATPH